MNFDLHLEPPYQKFQVKGTVFIRNVTKLPMEQQKALDAGAGEIFLAHVHRRISIGMILKVALELGDVYMLRFKIGFTGCSRGFAYLQYTDIETGKLALQVLQERFRCHRLKILVRESNNRRSLVLKNVEQLTPVQVYQQLRNLFPYQKLSVHEYQPLKYFYMIVYRNNAEAMNAYNKLRTKIGLFGSHAYIAWLDCLNSFDVNVESKCCLQLKCCGRHDKGQRQQCKQQQTQRFAQNDDLTFLCFKI